MKEYDQYTTAICVTGNRRATTCSHDSHCFLIVVEVLPTRVHKDMRKKLRTTINSSFQVWLIDSSSELESMYFVSLYKSRSIRAATPVLAISRLIGQICHAANKDVRGRYASRLSGCTMAHLIELQSLVRSIGATLHQGSELLTSFCLSL